MQIDTKEKSWKQIKKKQIKLKNNGNRGILIYPE